MKRPRSMVVLFLLLLFLCVSAPAQWQQTNGPYGGHVACYAVSGATVYAGSIWGGLFRSSDGGLNWKEKTSGLPRVNISSLALVGTTVFAGTDGAGVFRSLDSGDTWEASSVAFPNLYILALAATATGIFAATGGNTLYHSTDLGESWTTLNYPMQGADIRLITLSDHYLYVGTWSNGIFRSSDGGQSWTDLNNGLPDTHVSCLTLFPDGRDSSDLFVGIGALGIFRSTNQGMTWTPANNGLPATARSVSDIVVLGSDLFAATYEGVYRSTDRGASWSQSSGGQQKEAVRVLAISGTALLAGVDDDAVLRSTDQGATWTISNKGLINTVASAFAAMDSHLFAGTFGSGVYYSTNDGTDWVAINTNPPVKNVRTLFTYGASLLAGGDEEPGPFRSTDYGGTWVRADSGVSGSAVLAFASSGNTLFTSLFGGMIGAPPEDRRSGSSARGRPSSAPASAPASYGGVFRSIDSGRTWLAAAGLSIDWYEGLLACDSLLLVGGDSVFRSTNDGASWMPASEGLTNRSVHAFAIFPDGTGQTLLFAGTSRGVFRSTDRGLSWMELGGEISIQSVVSMAGYNTTLFAGTDGGGVFCTSDAGLTWVPVNSGLGEMSVYSLAVKGTYLFAGTVSRGVWRRPLSEMVTGIEAKKELPGGFSLDQNYPNPFNPTTTIRYALPHRSRVSLIVYNTLGQQVTSLVDGEVEAGYHEVQVNGSGLASGVYFYRLQAGDFVQTKKLVLLH